jgi:TonB family protein
MNRKNRVGLVLIILALALIVASSKISVLLQKGLGIGIPPVPLTELGQTIQVSGVVTALNPPQFNETPLSGRQPLYQGMEVRTGPGATATLHLNNGFEMVIFENSRAFIDLWNRQVSTSPIWVSMIHGSLKVLKQGNPSDLYILEDGQLVDPVHPVRKESHPLVISGFATQTPFITPSSPPSETPTPSVSNGGSDSAAAANTLSDSYMDSVLASQKAKFARCQTNALRNQKVAQGDVVLGFRINNDGRTSDVRILSSTMNDETFQSCLLEVIMTLRFQAFPGAPITRSFDLKFD